MRSTENEQYIIILRMHRHGQSTCYSKGESVVQAVMAVVQARMLVASPLSLHAQPVRGLFACHFKRVKQFEACMISTQQLSPKKSGKPTRLAFNDTLVTRARQALVHTPARFASLLAWVRVRGVRRALHASASRALV